MWIQPAHPRGLFLLYRPHALTRVPQDLAPRNLLIGRCHHRWPEIGDQTKEEAQWRATDSPSSRRTSSPVSLQFAKDTGVPSTNLNWWMRTNIRPEAGSGRLVGEWQ